MLKQRRHIKGPNRATGLTNDGAEEVRQSLELPLVARNWNSLYLDDFDVIVVKTDSGLGMMVRSVCVCLLQSSTFASLPPVRHFFLDCLRKTFVAEVACLQLIRGEVSLLLHSVKKHNEEIKV